MKRWSVLLSVLAAAVSTAACNAANCSFVSQPALVVTVVDSASSQNITPGSSAVARQGFFTDSVAVPSTATQTTIPLAYNRTGIYNLTVHHTGYRDWTRSGIGVVGIGCGIKETVAITAKLIK